MTTCNTDKDTTILLHHMSNTQLVSYADDVHISFDSSELIKELCDRLTKLGDSKHILNKDTGVISSPFDIESILQSCPVLLAKWKYHPFTFEETEEGHVVVVYIK